MPTAKKALFSAGLLLTLLVIVELALRLGGVVFYPRAITLSHEADREIADVRLVPASAETGA